MSESGWTDARVETLTALWLSGLSAAQVAAALGGGVSRNAVIGKAHRLGLARPPLPREPRRVAALQPSPPRRARALAAPLRGPGREPAAAPHAPPIAACADEPGLVRELVALARQACRWPIGDPSTTDFTFCGKPAAGGGPYCADHHRRAHRPGGAPLDRDPLLRRLLLELA